LRKGMVFSSFTDTSLHAANIIAILSRISYLWKCYGSSQNLRLFWLTLQFIPDTSVLFLKWEKIIAPSSNYLMWIEWKFFLMKNLCMLTGMGNVFFLNEKGCLKEILFYQWLYCDQ
jgi:hypothetical protein